MSNPIFLLGTGRCGSTFWQRLLCAADDVWIWGEHDGLLYPFSAMLDHMSRESSLTRWAIRADGAITDLNLSSGDATEFAWNNGFDLESLKSSMRRFIEDLFAKGLPHGKTRWGFKEIRYGPNSKVAELLLELYENCKIVVPVRDPRETIFSSAVAWNREIFDSQQTLNTDAAMQAFAGHRDNWLQFHEYFVALSNLYPDRVAFAYLGSQSSAEATFRFLGLEWNKMHGDMFGQVINSNDFARAGLYADPSINECLDLAMAPALQSVQYLDSELRRLACF